MTRHIKLVAVREVTARLRDRGFLVFTALMIVLIPGGAGVMAFFGGGDARSYSIATAGSGHEKLVGVLTQRAAAVGGSVELRRLPDRQAASEAVREGEVEAALVGESRILTDGRLEGELEALLQGSAASLRTAQALRAAGQSGDEVRAALDPAPLAVTEVGDRGGDPRNLVVAMFGSILLFLALYLYGYFIAAGVVEEKSSRVVEVVLAAVRPTQLLAGKVLGVGVLALAQLVLTIALAVGVATVAGVDLPPVTFGAAGSVVLWFVAGFAFYSCVFAVAGSLVSKFEDVQYTQLPPMVLILAGYFVSVQYVTGSLDPTVAHVLAYVPPFSPMVMPVLSSSGAVAAWEPAVAALTTVAAALVLMRVAARVYTGSVLRFGGRVPLREAWS